ncbi:hypothetical protein [uncultured Agrococcus sp.]|uniref:hypothetical protein n=1 Tax=uncultured Agrococcus sp. TaxID=382258 RepID=UPI0025F5523A|nr:hypothetical protein [uncultured Agrococcus sp.]
MAQVTGGRRRLHWSIGISLAATSLVTALLAAFWIILAPTDDETAAAYAFAIVFLALAVVLLIAASIAAAMTRGSRVVVISVTAVCLGLAIVVNVWAVVSGAASAVYVP